MFKLFFFDPNQTREIKRLTTEVLISPDKFFRGCTVQDADRCTCRIYTVKTERSQGGMEL